MRRRFLNNIKSISSSNDYHSEYFTIEALEDGLTASLSTNACEYRINNGSWNTLSAGSNTPSINKGQTLSFRGNLTPTLSNGIGRFTISKKCNVKCNIMSLRYGDDFKGQNVLTGNSTFYRLFYNCTNIVDASKLILPATTLTDYCYESMFYGCKGLTAAPELPATTLAARCYESMFYGCKGLTTAPELPATTLTNYCYDSMFYGCTSLTEAPELHATTLASYCYQYMFYGCTSLTTAPELPATTLTKYCYYRMFYGCKGLTTVPELPATTLANYCYQYMFYGCKNLTTAPELPATTLANCCYKYMFYGTNVLPDCSNIDFNSISVAQSGGLRGLFAGTKVTDADLNRILPKNSNGKYCLPATTLTNYCYDSMFDGCTSLTTAPELPATTLASYCYDSMFDGCTSLTTAPELPATTLASYCYDSMFDGCTSLTEAPELHATTLASYCYQYMFYGCTSLTTAPELPATTLASYCYQYMFYGCSKLNKITMLATNISVSGCLSSWVSGVASNGTFVKNPDMTSLPTGPNGIPNGWTVVDNGSNLITFTIAGTEYQAEEGMTWADWYVSNYNSNRLEEAYNPPKDSIYENLDMNVMTGIGMLRDEYGNAVYFGDVIIKNHHYSPKLPDCPDFV